MEAAGFKGARVGDAHALGSIARHAEHESVRTRAFESIDDHGEVLAVALNSEFKDPTLAAVERVTDRGELEELTGDDSIVQSVMDFFRKTAFDIVNANPWGLIALIFAIGVLLVPGITMVKAAIKTRQ